MLSSRFFVALILATAYDDVSATEAAIEIWQSAVPYNGPMLAQWTGLGVDVQSLQQVPVRFLAPLQEIGEDLITYLAGNAAFARGGQFGHNVLQAFAECAGDLAGFGADVAQAAVPLIRGQISDTWGWGMFPSCFSRSPWGFAVLLVGLSMAALEQARQAAYTYLHRRAMQSCGLEAAIMLTSSRIQLLTAAGLSFTKSSFEAEADRAVSTSTPTRRPAALEDKSRSGRRARSLDELSSKSRAGSVGAEAGWAALSPEERSARASSIAKKRWSTSPGPK